MKGLSLGLSLTGSSGAFSIASLSPFAWWDFSDVSSMATGTTAGSGAVSATSTVGFVADKSGNGRDLTQGTAAARPTAQTGYLNFDGGDGLATATGLTPPASADVFIVLRNVVDTQFILVIDPPAASRMVGWAQSGGSDTPTSGSGTPTTLVNGAALGANTTAGMFTAIGNTATKVIEHQGANLSAWDGFTIADYPSFEYTGRLMELLIFPALTPGQRAQVRTYLTAKHGVS